MRITDWALMVSSLLELLSEEVAEDVEFPVICWILLIIKKLRLIKVSKKDKNIGSSDRFIDLLPIKSSSQYLYNEDFGVHFWDEGEKTILGGK